MKWFFSCDCKDKHQPSLSTKTKSNSFTETPVINFVETLSANDKHPIAIDKQFCSLFNAV
jgi:hypothetical protein